MRGGMTDGIAREGEGGKRWGEEDEKETSGDEKREDENKEPGRPGAKKGGILIPIVP